MSHINGIVRIDKQLDGIIHLHLVCMIEFLESLHLLHIACLRADLYAFVHAVGKYQFQRTAHIEKCGVMPAFGLACFLRLHTADDVVLPGILQCQPTAYQGRNDDFIIVICRQPDPCTCQFCCLHQKFMRRTVPYTDRERRLRQKYMHGSLDTHKGQVIGNVNAFLILSSRDQVLEQAVACKSFRRCSITALVQVV